MHTILALVGALATTAWAGPTCGDLESPRTDQQLSEELTKAEDLIRAGTAGRAMSQQMDRVEYSLSCLGEAITPETATRYHLVRMIGYDPLGGLPEARLPALKAHAIRLRTLDPDLSLAAKVIPEGHAHRDLLGELEPDTTTLAAPRPSEGALVFDGERTLERPASSATVFQLLDGNDRVRISTVLLPSAALPEYATARTAKKKGPLMFVSIGAAALAGGLGAGSVVAEGALSRSYANASPGGDDPLQPGPTIAMAAGAFTMGGVALGTGIGALVGGAK